jgi:SAM-dependent methyltransferase
MDDEPIDQPVAETNNQWMTTPEQRQQATDDAVSKFEVFFDAPYTEIKSALSDHIKTDDQILDIGANQGNLEDFLDTQGGHHQIQCVDTDDLALEQLKGKQYKNLEISAVTSDANQFLKTFDGKVDVVLINATLHEINDPANQANYLRQLFNKAKEMLKPGGRIIIGDYYYPDDVSDEEVERFIAYQRQAINHADGREKFVKPELISDIATKEGYKVVFNKEIQAVKEIDRRYYVIVIAI